MSAELAVIKSDTDETNGSYQRQPDGKFAPGNKGGSGGPRPGSGRPPKPADETLLTRLYTLLDGNADRALEVLIDQLESKDPKVAQKAASIVLSKTLPEARFLKGWEEQGEKFTPEALELWKEFFAWKQDRDIAQYEERNKDHPPAEEAEDDWGDNDCQ